MKPLPRHLLPIVLLVAGCSSATDSLETPSWPELQYEPPALVELEQEPLLVWRKSDCPSTPDWRQG